jgi:hypothetical protein
MAVWTHEQIRERIIRTIEESGRPLSIYEMRTRPLWLVEHLARSMEQQGLLELGLIPKGPYRLTERQRVVYGLRGTPLPRQVEPGQGATESTRGEK